MNDKREETKMTTRERRQKRMTRERR